jgi:hypothetical protein
LTDARDEDVTDGRADMTGRTSVVDGPVVEIDVMLDPEKLRRVAVD